MKHLGVAALCATAMVWTTLAPTPANSGIVDRACRSSGRTAATPQLCRCIQKVANTSLTRSERKRAVKLFKDPHMAQEVRQSDRSSDETFWRRYKAFGERARQTCG